MTDKYLPCRLAGLRGPAYYTALRQTLREISEQLINETILIKKTTGKISPVDIGRLSLKYGLNFKATCKCLEECRVIPAGIHSKLIERGVKVRDIYEKVKHEDRLRSQQKYTIFAHIPLGGRFVEVLSPCNEIATRIEQMTIKGKLVNARRAKGKWIYMADWEPVLLMEETEWKALIGFAGFGGPDIALREAGFETVGIENDPAIAEVNRYNGGNVITIDILKLTVTDFVDYSLMHFSPPCPNFSVAKSGGIEGETDILLARRICEFVRICRPKYFTLENVWGYRKSLSWLLVWYTLLEEGYGVDAWHLNAADYGVPQSRRRMIVIARRDGRQPEKPWPTHSKTPDMFTKPWIGWHEAIQDLIPELPDSEFAPWQRDRLPEEWKTFLINNKGGGDTLGAMPRAFLLMTGNTNRGGVDNKPGRGCLGANQPANTVSTGLQGGRAFLIPGENTSNGVVRDASDPMVTVATRPPERCPHRAFIVNQTNGSVNEFGNRGLSIRQEDQPSFTMTASANRTTVRAGLPQGRVVSMTPRALARFQQFPDWYVLPSEPGLDENIVLLLDPRPNREITCRGIGNALPPGLYRAVLKSLGF